MSARRDLLERLAAKHGVLAIYLLGSRADDGLRLLEERSPTPRREGSDLDVGLAFRPETPPNHCTLADLQVGVEDVFEPLRIDLVPMHKVDSIFQARIIDGHRVLTTDEHAVNELELVIMRRAAELLPIQRQIERDLFGVSTT